MVVPEVVAAVVAKQQLRISLAVEAFDDGGQVSSVRTSAFTDRRRTILHDRIRIEVDVASQIEEYVIGVHARELGIDGGEVAVRIRVQGWLWGAQDSEPTARQQKRGRRCDRPTNPCFKAEALRVLDFACRQGVQQPRYEPDPGNEGRRAHVMPHEVDATGVNCEEHDDEPHQPQAEHPIEVAGAHEHDRARKTQNQIRANIDQVLDTAYGDRLVLRQYIEGPICEVVSPSEITGANCRAEHREGNASVQDHALKRARTVKKQQVDAVVPTPQREVLLDQEANRRDEQHGNQNLSVATMGIFDKQCERGDGNELRQSVVV